MRIVTGTRNDASAAASAGGTIPTDTAAKLLMVTPEWVRRLTKDGWIRKVAKDQYRIVDAVQGYINYLKDEARKATKSAAASRVQEARAREIELRTAREEGRLWDAETAEATFAEILGGFRSELGGVAAASTRDLAVRAAIEKHLNEAIERCDARLANAAAGFRAGADVGDVEGEEADA